MSALKATRTFSCAECRRLKLKCNRQWPCAECVRRGTAHLCPNATSSHGPSRAKQVVELQGRIKQLEELLGQTAAPQVPTIVNQGAAPLLSGLPPSLPQTFPPDTRADESRETRSVIPGPSQTPSSTIETVGELKRNTGGNSRFFGVTAAEHRLAMAAENEGEGSSESIKPAFLSTTWSSSLEWALHPKKSTTINLKVDDILAFLPSRAGVLSSVERYWECTLWRFEPFTKTFFDRVLDEVYPSTVDAPPPHPHRLALVVAVLALSELFSSASGSREVASSYHNYTWSALAIGNFLSDVSIASLCAIHLVCGYILNAEGTLDELYVLVGLGVRLAISAGFHRDGSWWNIEQPELDDRRRIWWELTQLERVHSFTLGLPTTLPTACDTAKPSNLSPISFLFWKWDLLVLVSKMIEKTNMGRAQSYPDIVAADREMRGFDASLPVHLRSEDDRPSLAAYEQSTVLGSEGLPHLLAVQQIRLAQLYNMSMFHLHRSSFTTALRGESEMLDGPLACSVLALLIESSGNVLSLISALMQIAPTFAHFSSNSLELFNVLACQAAVLIRRPNCLLKEHCREHMDSALNLMERIYEEKPTQRLEILLQKSRKLRAEATAALAKADGSASWVSPWGALPSEPDRATSGNHSQNAANISNVDFDIWLSQILQGDDMS